MDYAPDQLPKQDVSMHIDLNADLGEGAPHDSALLALVSSANISCGVHAGDPDSLAAAIRQALVHGVRIGAHPSFPDRERAGRAPMHLPFPQLRNQLLYQLGALGALVRAQGTRLAHVKPHGALYNQAAEDRQLAEDLVLIVQEFDPSLALVGLAGSELLYAARQVGLRFIAEAFADRRYANTGSLLPRSDARALIHDPQEALAQSLQIITDGFVTAVDGSRVPVQADTLCLHGDTAEALQLAQTLRASFLEAGIMVRAGQ
jgi:UPF0271 protein